MKMSVFPVENAGNTSKRVKMYKLSIALLTAIISLILTSCAVERAESYDIKNALKINTWVLDESIEDNDYYVIDESTGKMIDNPDVVYKLDRLK